MVIWNEVNLSSHETKRLKLLRKGVLYLVHWKQLILRRKDESEGVVAEMSGYASTLSFDLGYLSMERNASHRDDHLYYRQPWVDY